MGLRSMFRRRIGDPLLALLRVGVTPRRIALSAAVGAGIGLNPFVGTTTLLCTAVALTARLNLVAMQSFNWLVAGMQLLLIIPFMRMGEWMFNAESLGLTASEIQALFREGFLHAVQTLGISLGYALAGWGVTVPFVMALVYGIVLKGMRVRERRINANQAPVA